MIRLECHSNEKLENLLDIINKDKKMEAIWKCVNVNAIDRLGFNDHGPVHIQIVCKNALQLLRILFKNKILPNVMKDYGLEYEDAEVIIILAAVLHDIGMVVKRDRHEIFSIALAEDFIDRYLEKIYDNDEIKMVIKAEVLHSIISHESGNNPLTLEAGILRCADALDMEKGRARIPFQIGSVNIHSVSALAIEKVDISEGEEKPIFIKIRMSNSAGIYQIDELLKNKIKDTPIEKYIKVFVEVIPGKEKNIVHSFEF